MGSILYDIFDGLVNFVVFVIIADAILSWLVAFDVVNLRNRAVASVAHALNAISRPVLAPFRRFIPPLGGVDITPVIALIVIQALQHAVHRMVLGTPL